MICASCPLSTDEPCELYETHAIEDKDGYCRCNVPWSKIHKIDMEYADYLGNMGTDLGIEHDLEMDGIPKEKVIELCKHMIGLDYKAPYHRHGKAFYKPYRNYFDAPEGGNRYLEALPEYILRRHDERSGGVWYTLTREGLDWLGRQLHMTIYDKE